MANGARVDLGDVATAIPTVLFELGLARKANTGLFPVNISTQSEQIMRSRL